MQLTQTNKNVRSNGDRSIEFTYDTMETIDDLISFISFIEKEYGEIEEIKCLKINDSKKVELFLGYSDLSDLIKNGPKDLVKIVKTISFSCKERHISFIINTNTKKINISILENTLGPKAYDETKIKYYRNNYGDIIKYDENKNIYYFLSPNTKKWVVNQSLMDKFYDAQYSFTPIEYEENENNNSHKERK